MDVHRLALRRSLITWLCTACPGLVQAMKETSQVHPLTPSVFHMEDSVWTHVMLVLHTALEQAGQAGQTDFCLEDIVTALVHDVAKPLTACVRPAKQGTGYRISFAGHGPLGTQAAVDCSCALRMALSLPLSNNAIARIAAVTSGHIAFYNISDASQALTFCNRDPRLLRTMTRLLYCDMQGSIADTTCKGFTGNLALLQATSEVLRTAVFPQETENTAFAMTSGPGVHLVCGLPSPARDRFAARLARGRQVVHVQSHAGQLSLGAKAGSDVQTGSGAQTGGSRTGRAAGNLLPPLLAEDVSRLNSAQKQALARNKTLFVSTLRQRASQAEAGLFVCADLATTAARNAVYSLISTALPGVPLTCTYILVPSAPWHPAMPGPLEKGLPAHQRELQVPSLFREPALAAAAIELVTEEGLYGSQAARRPLKKS